MDYETKQKLDNLWNDIESVEEQISTCRKRLSTIESQMSTLVYNFREDLDLQVEQLGEIIERFDNVEADLEVEG